MCTTFEPDGCFRCKLFTLNQKDDSVAQKCLGLPVKFVPPLRLSDENSSYHDLAESVEHKQLHRTAVQCAQLVNSLSKLHSLSVITFSCHKDPPYLETPKVKLLRLNGKEKCQIFYKMLKKCFLYKYCKRGFI